MFHSNLEYWVMVVIGVEGGGGRPGKEQSLRLALLLERDGMGWEEAMPTQMSHEAWHFLQPEGLAVLGTKVCSSGKASQPVPGQWWAQLTLKRQRQDLGCDGGRGGGFGFILDSSYLSLEYPCSLPLATCASPGNLTII